MRIYIDIAECKNHTGKVIAAMPQVDIEVGIDEGYDMHALHDLKRQMEQLIEEKLNGGLQ